MAMIDKILQVDYQKRPTVKELLEDKWVSTIGEGNG